MSRLRRFFNKTFKSQLALDIWDISIVVGIFLLSMLFWYWFGLLWVALGIMAIFYYIQKKEIADSYKGTFLKPKEKKSKKGDTNKWW